MQGKSGQNTGTDFLALGLRVVLSLRKNDANSEFFALTEFRGESSVSSFQPTICVPKRSHFFLAELTEFGAELSEFPLPKEYKQYSARSQIVTTLSFL